MMRATLRRLAFVMPLASCSMFAVVPACTGGFAAPEPYGALDGGVGNENPDCLPYGVDAGPDAGEPCPAMTPDGGCDALIAQTCGETCLESPGCAAAQLVSQYEPYRCGEALADTQTFPACQAGSCDTLVDKVCGVDQQCLDAPGCPPALELQARGADPDATQEDVAQAASQCLQALEDDIVFAACAA